ncbi:MAG: hypothetical protein UY96_C0003G0041 [Parcubacteria group bacterium GW2011_GWB1_56_8]|nr:MAG: hypothetical protein UY96_C0003G0041 [Parcubacteria group bacterium GW2011_GWB1_56_8]
MSSEKSALERVRKLLRLARSSNPHEAEAAKVRAQALMSQHGFTNEDVAEDVVVIVEEQPNHYREDLARLVARAKDCLMVTNKRRVIALRGRKRDVKMARDLYRALLREGEFRGEMSSTGNPPAAARAVWRSCFWFGFLGALMERLLNIPARIPKGVYSDGQGVPQAVAEALEAAEALAEQLDEEIVDVQGVLERLRQRAYDTGRMVGERVEIGEQRVNFYLTNR